MAVAVPILYLVEIVKCFVLLNSYFRFMGKFYVPYGLVLWI